jgi:2-keto-4-pentenoate hydratase/2-oxohepta-3-ene-1,7-dioic acid hydratase in catechol pathway
MKLVTYVATGAPRIGVIAGDGIADIALALPDAPKDMIGLIAGWETWRDRVAGLAAGEPDVALGDVRLLAPVPRPGKIMAIGLNYADHIAESGQKTPEQQLWFAKMSSSSNGPHDDIEIPATTNFVDYEAELVAIVGTGGRNIARGDAAASIFGYCAGNDVTARDWQFKTAQWTLGKSFDTHAPMGPWIVTTDEIGDPHDLGIRALVNGETRQESNTGNLVFDVFAQVEELSKAMTLEPGDAIFTGTPGGVGIAMKPPVALKAGDRVRIEIDRIGALDALMVVP